MRYFELSEFDSPDAIGSGAYMNNGFLNMLDRARGIADIPFIVTSGYRTHSHNKSVGGSPTSSHMKGIAVDLAYSDVEDSIRMIRALGIVGFDRIGVGSGFIHVDSDNDKPEAYWTYQPTTL